jgi:23S rRNA (adenine2503-C2)-methyltransferase
MAKEWVLNQAMNRRGLNKKSSVGPVSDLIRFHPHPGSPYRRPTEDRVNDFRSYLYPRCPAVTVRKSFGLDIDAACGQLAGRSNPFPVR